MPDHPKKKRSSIALRIIEVLLVIVIVVCLGIVGFIAAQYFTQSRQYSELSSEVVEVKDGSELSKMSVDWDALRQECPDAIGWIIVPDTVIDYPVVQGPDNEYYLHRSYDGEQTWASTGGTVFLDASNKSDFSDMNNALYGHNMNDGSMFAFLATLSNQDAFDAHRTIYLLTPTMNYRLETFAVVLTTGSDAIVQTNFSSSESFSSYVQDKLDRSVVDSGLDVKATSLSKIFMLVTCEYSQSDGRSCLYARVAEQAEPTK